MQDLCSTIGEMRDYFEGKGHRVFTAVHEQDNLYDQSKVDFNLSSEIEKYYKSFSFKLRYRLFKENADKRVRQKLLRKILRENEIFIMYHPSIFSDFDDLRIIREAGKKLVCLVFGDDVRWYNAMKQWHAHRSIPPMEYDQEYVDALTVDKWVGYLRHVEKYADVVIMHPDTAHMALRPYFHYYMQLDASRFLPSRAQKKSRPVVAHAPSNKKIKGTEYVLKAVKELQDEGLDFEFRLMEKVPYNKVYDFYQDIDIMVVQLLAHGGGKQSYELLSCGKVVISRMQYDAYLPHIKEECPIVDADIHTIKDVLRQIVLDYNQRVDLAARGRDYVMKYHDIKSFCDRILKELKEPKSAGDYQPGFFRNTYQPAKKEVADLNKWTRFVSDRDWYGELVKPGEREGLQF